MDRLLPSRYTSAAKSAAHLGPNQAVIISINLTGAALSIKASWA